MEKLIGEIEIKKEDKTLQIGYFTDRHIPQKILFRDEELKKIEDVFRNYSQYGSASNLILLGHTGSGKTLIITTLPFKYSNIKIISASNIRYTHQILQKLVGSNTNKISTLLDLSIKLLRENGSILIIDEFNKIEDITSFFDNLNTIYRETGTPIILVTNNVGMLSKMPEDARLTLFFEKVIFKPYDSYELVEIANERIKLLDEEYKAVITEEGLKGICALAAKSGSARTMLGLLKRCLIAKDFSIEFIEKLNKNDEREELEALILSFNEKEKIFLEKLVDIHAINMEADITPAIIQQSLPDFSPSRISQMITAFEHDYGLITTRYVSKGKAGGRYRIISFSSHEIFCLLEGVI